MVILIKVIKKFLKVFMKLRINLILIIGISLLFLTIPVKQVQATFSLSVKPYEGSFDLRFGRADQNVLVERVEKEVAVDITTDIGKRYQLVQTLLSPLVNAQGVSLARNALTVYTLKGSNSRGTLQLDSEIPLNPSRTFIYTSNIAGDSDSFIIVYGLDYSQISVSGIYRGRLNFTLEPIDSTQRPARVNLDLEVSIEATSQIEVNTSTGAKTIEIESPPRTRQPFEVSISIRAQPYGQYKIFQEVERLVDAQAEELRDGVYFSLANGKSGVLAYGGEALLKPGRTLLYTSSPSGADDEIVISFSLKEGLLSGRYRGSISYFIEGPQRYAKGGLLEAFPLNVKINPVFELKITPQTTGIIEFRNLKPEEIQEVEVLIEIESNLNRAYQVSQIASSLLTSEEGAVIPEEYFRFRSKGFDKETKGTLKHPTETNVEIGEKAIFVSDKVGSSDKFGVIYKLTVPRDMKAGDYKAAISYSLAPVGIE